MHYGDQAVGTDFKFFGPFVFFLFADGPAIDGYNKPKTVEYANGDAGRRIFEHFLA